MGLNDSKTLRGGPQVKLHPNARTTPYAREQIVDRVLQALRQILE